MKLTLIITKLKPCKQPDLPESPTDQSVFYPCLEIFLKIGTNWDLYQRHCSTFFQSRPLRGKVPTSKPTAYSTGSNLGKSKSTTTNLLMSLSPSTVHLGNCPLIKFDHNYSTHK